jgi:hypothetical protein
MQTFKSYQMMCSTWCHHKPTTWYLHHANLQILSDDVLYMVSPQAHYLVSPPCKPSNLIYSFFEREQVHKVTSPRLEKLQYLSVFYCSVLFPFIAVTNITNVILHIDCFLISSLLAFNRTKNVFNVNSWRGTYSHANYFRPFSRSFYSFPEFPFTLRFVFVAECYCSRFGYC